MQFELNRRRKWPSVASTTTRTSRTRSTLQGRDCDRARQGRRSTRRCGCFCRSRPLVRNKDQKSNDYDTMAKAYRPESHRTRPTTRGRARASKVRRRPLLRTTNDRERSRRRRGGNGEAHSGVEVLAYVQAVQTCAMPESTETPSFANRGRRGVAPRRCPDPETAEKMIERIDQSGRQGNSMEASRMCGRQRTGRCVGALAFDKLEAELAKPACRRPRRRVLK